MLAVATGIPAATWAEEGEQAIVTAFDVLERGSRPATGAGGEQLSG